MCIRDSFLATLPALPALPSIQTIFTSNVGKIGGYYAGGYYTTFANLSLAAYHITSGEIPGAGLNDAKPFADDRWTSLKADTNWEILQGAALGGSHGPNDLIPGEYWEISSEGIYTCANASAYAVVCGDSLVITFRGTNDNDEIHGTRDELSWLNMTGHYDLLKPFVAAVDKYVTDNPNITKVYATGHSLGGAMALAYMAQPAHQGSKYEAVTFAAPGWFGDADDILQASRLAAAVAAVTTSGAGGLIAFIGVAAIGMEIAKEVSLSHLDSRIVGIEIDGDLVPDLKYPNGSVSYTHLTLPTNREV